MRTVLFLCTGNTCRSQMAEGFAREHAGDELRVFSAGMRPAGLDPRAVLVMAEVGIDIAQQRSKGLDAVPLDDVVAVVTLCEEAEAECPRLGAEVERHHWPLEDPARARETEKDVLPVYRRVRDDIRRHVEAFLRAPAKRI